MSNLFSARAFARSGLAALSDLQDPEFVELFSYLETEQRQFLDKDDQFRRSDYQWPRDVIHCWSRQWEYPYIYHHLRASLQAKLPNRNVKVVDLGSAVTFFPFSVAKLGCHVYCLDVDADCGPDIDKAVAVVDHAPGSLEFGLISNDRLPLGDSEVDALYCISVLEHVPSHEKTVQEVSRVLRPGGLFALTIDMDLCGYKDIGVGKYYELRRLLAKHFELVEPETVIHPLDTLRASNGQYPYLTFSTWQRCKFHAKQRLRPFVGKSRLAAVLPDLAVWCGIFRKKQES